MKKVYSIFFLLVLLSSSIGVALGNHFCDGKLVKTSLMLGLTDMSCGMSESGTKCPLPHKYSNQQVLIDNCCDNDYNLLQLDDAVSKKVVLERINFDFTLAYSVILVKQKPSSNHYNSHLKESLPQLKQKIPILLQSFLW